MSAAFDHFRAVRGVGEELRPGAARSHRVEDLELHAQARQAVLVAGPALDVQVIPPRAADRADQHRVGRARRRHRLVATERAVSVPGGAAEEVFGHFHLEPGEIGHALEHPEAAADHLGTDVVAGEGEDFEGRAHARWGSPANRLR